MLYGTQIYGYPPMFRSWLLEPRKDFYPISIGPKSRSALRPRCCEACTCSLLENIPLKRCTCSKDVEDQFPANSLLTVSQNGAAVVPQNCATVVPAKRSLMVKRTTHSRRQFGCHLKILLGLTLDYRRSNAWEAGEGWRVQRVSVPSYEQRCNAPLFIWRGSLAKTNSLSV
jgi:hypothetical protein